MMAFDNGRLTKTCFSIAQFSPLCIGRIFSASTGGGYGDLGNFVAGQSPAYRVFLRKTRKLFVKTRVYFCSYLCFVHKKYIKKVVELVEAAVSSFPALNKTLYEYLFSCAECRRDVRNYEFGARISLKPNGAEEFLARNSITSIKNTLSEDSDGFAAFNKMLSEASDGFTAFNKTLSEASDGFTAFNKTLSEASAGFTAFNKTLSEVSDGFMAFNRIPSEAFDTPTATNKALSETSDGFTATNNILSETSDTSAQHCAGKFHRIKTTAAHVAATYHTKGDSL